MATPLPARAATPSSRVLELFQGHRLTPTQRRVAQCVVEHASEAAYASSSQIAELARVSQPSVTRFAVALGYDGYPALRQRIRGLVTGEPDRTPDEARRNELQHAVGAESDNLRRLAVSLADPGPVARAALLLSGSRPLPVLGLRASAPLAGYFGYFCAKIHPDVRLLDTGGSLLVDRLEQARAAGASALLAFALPRYPRETLDALGAARDAGLHVVTVTDTAVSPAAALSDVVLPAPVGSQLVFDLHTAPMVLTMVLLQALCDAAPAEAQARLEESERSATRRQVFAP